MQADAALALALALFGGDAPARNAAPPPVASVERYEWRNVVTYRQPAGHTHTCPYCRTTWDHAANPTHQCRACGASQYVIDQPSRMVRVVTKQKVRVE